MLRKSLFRCVLLIASSLSFTALADLANDRYILVNKLSGKVLDVAGMSQNNSANILQWSLGSGLNQRWDIHSLGDGYYSILAAHSGKSLDVAGRNLNNGANIIQYTNYGQNNQQWSIVNNGDGYFQILSRLNGKALEVGNFNTSNGGNIQLWDNTGTDSQFWSLIPTGASGYEKSAFEITNEMGAGWNLGNALDAIGGETNWGNPATEKYMIDAIAARGFKTIRLPITWQDYINNNVNIESWWLDRIETVVNYAIDNGLYVIINVHHDEWVVPTYAHKDASIAQLTTVWTQISERFKHYNQYLIFETLNEPRANKGTALEWSGTTENYSVINELNAAALSAIRSSGGNNNKRLVMIPGYAASPWNDQTNYLTIPNDNLIAISTHGYIPYDFVENPAGTTVFSQTEKDLIDYVLGELNSKYISQGVPVIMGEWGTIDKNNTADRIAYAQYYANTASSLGIPMIVWDNNALGGGQHDYQLYNRENNTWSFGNIADAIIANSY